MPQSVNSEDGLVYPDHQHKHAAAVAYQQAAVALCRGADAHLDWAPLAL